MDLSRIKLFVGVVAGSMLAFILPSLVYLKSHRSELLSILGRVSSTSCLDLPDKCHGDHVGGPDSPPPLSDGHLPPHRICWRVAQALGLCLFGVFALGSGLFSMAVRELHINEEIKLK